jgi:hypothetical protein
MRKPQKIASLSRVFTGNDPFRRVSASSGLFRAHRLHHIWDSWISGRLRRPETRRDSSRDSLRPKKRRDPHGFFRLDNADAADGGLGMTRGCDKTARHDLSYSMHAPGAKAPKRRKNCRGYGFAALTIKAATHKEGANATR